ncbi:hypothetical protein MMC11_003196 [Xylographa trunciseda]|nr:hypothetical protein [Xylographa trunciseda]
MKPSIQRLDTLVTKLPAELIQLILCTLPDAVTLRAVVLSHSSFYHAFLAGKDHITLQILLNQIHPDLLPDAHAVLRSSRLKPWSRELVQEFLIHYHDGQLSPLPAWTISDTVPISVLHNDIAFFMADFATMALAAHPITSVPDVSPSAFTSPEKSRICRTFYRFELYCNLFREHGWKDDRFSPREQRDIFFDKYSPWENEQLACVHDYLYRRMVAVYNDFAAHDIEWGEHHEFPSFLSLGLNYLRRLITAKTYEERYQLLAPNRRSDHSFLHEGLLASNTDDDDDDVELCHYSTTDERRWIRPPSLHDPDRGPAQAWRWAHEHESRDSFVLAEPHRGLRERGYVMWDSERLQRWGFFRAPWKRGREVRFDPVEEYEAMLRSFEERPKIYRRGGRGWWREGDESRVVWEKKEPHRARVKVIHWPH